jgi:ribosomal-protein-alanine N-acetyltransferase
MVNANTDNNESIFWGIAEQQNPYLLLGTVCLWNIVRENHSGELGYVLHPDARGKGYMREAVQPVIEFARQTGLHRLEAHTDPNNARSVALLRSFGFIHEGLLRENILFKEQWHDTAIFSILFDKK